MTTREIAERGTTLRVLAGSHLNGTATAQSDKDYLGVCVEPPEYVVGLRHFEQYEWSTSDGERSGPQDVGGTIYSLRKFCALALKGNPTVIALLFASREFCEVRTEEGEALQEMRGAFLSRRAGRAFLGYMEQQRLRMTGERGQKNVKRPELVAAYGYDTKYAHHVLRLGLQGVELMASGMLEFPMKDRKLLLAVRSGEATERQVLAAAKQLENTLERLLHTSPLPKEPDENAVNRFLVRTYLGRWAGA